jgi:hypothetical protein
MFLWLSNDLQRREQGSQDVLGSDHGSRVMLQSLRQGVIFLLKLIVFSFMTLINTVGRIVLIP